MEGMTQLTQDQVRHVAKLARLALSDEEVLKFSTQLTSVLQYIDVLNEVDTEGVEPTAQVTGLSNVLRADDVHPFPNPEALLACSPFPIQNRQIRVKPIL